MGGRQIANFEKRFPKGLVLIPEKPLEGAARRAQGQKMYAAVKGVLTGILKREPTPHELSGCEPIMHKKRS